jgi:hypothetical protein
MGISIKPSPNLTATGGIAIKNVGHSQFCQPNAVAVAGVTRQSLKAFYGALPPRTTALVEGTQSFKIHQVSLLSAAEHWLLFAAAQYRRAVDMLVPASVPWAQVTLYYSSFYSANAILAMCGGLIVSLPSGGSRMVDVLDGTRGAFRLNVHRRFQSPSGASGSHRLFWDIFYDAVPYIRPSIPAEHHDALTPVNANFSWQIDERNSINYDTHAAWDAAENFHKSFNPAKFIRLNGTLRLQFETAERLIKAALWLAKELGVASDAYASIGATGSNAQVRKKLASQRTPNLISETPFSAFWS